MNRVIGPSLACGAPMMLFASWIKHPFDVPVQRLHDADPSEHRWPAEIGDQDQRFHSRMPFRRLGPGLWMFTDVFAFPRSIGVGFTNPAAILAKRARHYR